MLVLQRVQKVEFHELADFYLTLYLLMKDISFRFYVVRILLFFVVFGFSEFL